MRQKPKLSGNRRPATAAAEARGVGLHLTFRPTPIFAMSLPTMTGSWEGSALMRCGSTTARHVVCRSPLPVTAVVDQFSPTSSGWAAPAGTGAASWNANGHTGTS